MKKLELSKITPDEYKELLKRPGIDIEKSYEIVKPILADIKSNSESAVIKFAKQFDALGDDELLISESEIGEAENFIPEKLKQAIQTAITNITEFHKKQLPSTYEIETTKGVRCGRVYKPIQNVGLYIPGGNAPLFSTLLMLAIPAQLAGCKRVVVCTPQFEGKIGNEVLYAANLMDIKEIYRIGGAQAIGLMAYGTENINKVDKIFGPGNQYVTTAKTIVSIDPDGCAIDMPAGPSEVLVIADENANPKFVAADLLSQAEHGADSQVILLSTNDKILEEVEKEIDMQLKELPRKGIAAKALGNSLLIKCESIEEMFEYSNAYAPEHLILHLENSKSHLHRISNAGSVFLGGYSPESVGDYASGTNHSLPTYGYAKSFSGVNVLSFMKGITYQELSPEGLTEIGPSVIEMATAEKLDAHANSVRVRLNG